MEISEKLIGRKVTLIDGPGQSPDPKYNDKNGEIIEVVVDRWGTHAVVEMDEDGRTCQVNSFTKVGIGFYLND